MIRQRPIPVRKTTLPAIKIRFSFSTKRSSGDPVEETYSDPNRKIPSSEPAGLVWSAVPDKN